MLGIWILGLFLLSAAEGKEVCYDRLGCFSDDAPWSGTVERPIYKLPWKPESIGTQFLLYTRQNENYAQVRTVSAVDKSTITASNFNTNRKTRFIVHGFIDHGEENWLSDMCKPGSTRCWRGRPEAPGHRQNYRSVPAATSHQSHLPKPCYSP
uniref:Triacylglycerol lipase n=1 Tax=Serinus canaria TaxID=9135 RepID=A0A8C9N4P1_SERCA